ncbi:unnamed protein product [Ilex paraguariensis]|uniref:Uncharacterized protein n=1 Tax=Ilex paraguariensis TaxID=185542 RepID=A0ABC8SLU9_9AQUA
MWRVMDLHIPENMIHMKSVLDKLCRHAVDLSKGKLLEINIQCIVTDGLLQYIAQQIRWRTSHIAGDEEALAIAENMPELRNFLLFGHKMTRDGLPTIVDSCPHLESFDLQKCLSVSIAGNLGRGYSEQIEDIETSESDSCDEECLSDIEFFPYDYEYY